MNFYFFLGATGWWAKFLVVFNHIKKISQNSNLHGIIMVPGLEREIFKNFPEHKKNLDYQYDLVERFLDSKLDIKDVEKYEKKYKNLWKYVYAERRFLTFTYVRRFQNKVYTHEELLKLIIGQFKYFEKTLENIDVLVTNPPASSWALVMCEVAKSYNIKIINVDQVAFPSNRSILTSSYQQIWTQVEKIFENKIRLKELVTDKQKLDAVDHVKKWREKAKQPPWVAITNTQKKVSKLLNLKKIKRFFIQYINFHLGKTFYVASPFLQIKQFIYFRYNSFMMHNFFSYDQVDYSDTYFYYPMHLEPEASLMISGRRAINQMSLIQRLATQLPAKDKLYVKEHPTMVGWRTKKFYKDLKKIPNVKLISPKYDNNKLIKNSLCIFTVCGTSGWEALMMKKPVFLIGESFYRKLSMVKYIVNLDDIKSELQWLSNEYQHSEDELIEFVSCIINQSFPFPFDYFWGTTDDDNIFEKLQNFDDFSKSLANEIYSYAINN